VAKKATNHESLLKTQEVYGYLTSGHSRGNIVRILSEQWGCSERQVDNYIAKARTLLEEDAAMARPAWLAEALGRLRTYEVAAAKRGQLQVAVNSVQTQAKLIGFEL
jgi:hypothetical protein